MSRLTFSTLSSSFVISRPFIKTSVLPLLASGLSLPVKFKLELIILSGFSPSCQINNRNVQMTCLVGKRHQECLTRSIKTKPKEDSCTCIIKCSLTFPQSPDSLSYQYVPGFNFPGGRGHPSNSTISSGFNGNPFTINCSGLS